MKTKQEARESWWLPWFPYPSSWLKSFALALWMAIVLRVAGFWGALIGMALSDVMKRPEALLWFLGLVLLASILVFSFIHHFLWGKPSASLPRWFPSSKSLWAGLYASIVMVLAIIVGVLCVLPFHNFETYSQTVLETEAGWFSVIWFVTATYLYQAEYLIRRRFTSESRTTRTQGN